MLNVAGITVGNVVILLVCAVLYFVSRGGMIRGAKEDKRPALWLMALYYIALIGITLTVARVVIALMSGGGVLIGYGIGLGVAYIANRPVEKARIRE